MQLPMSYPTTARLITKIFGAGLIVVSRCLFGLFGAYWLVFIGYTVTKLITGGPDAVVIWYKHVSDLHISIEASEWHWALFLLRQIVILAVTLLSWFIGRRSLPQVNTQT